jgi:hypothetical protein
MSRDKNEFSDLSDHELVDAISSVGDPSALEMIRAEERRRTSERALRQATKSNKIAIASLIVAILSFLIAALAVIQSG